MRAAGESLQLHASPLELRALVLVLVPILLFGRASLRTSSAAPQGGVQSPQRWQARIRGRISPRKCGMLSGIRMLKSPLGPKGLQGKNQSAVVPAGQGTYGMATHAQLAAPQTAASWGNLLLRGLSYSTAIKYRADPWSRAYEVHRQLNIKPAHESVKADK